ncbi:MAG: PrsW family intramembrane metalloprotease [Bacteroidaceae bacterium]|nr:PrsW family intramembrane metalloprotease [Bacteroidaceae bacterium]
MLIIIAAGLLPVIVLLIYILRKDTHPEPFAQLLKAIFWGMAICFPVALVEKAISFTLFGPAGEPANLFGTTVQAFFMAALPEESFKLLALWFMLRRNPYFDEHFDGIVYAVCIGLGFAGVENIGYLLGNIESWTSVAISRALLAVPGHYAFAVMMGYYYSVHHFIDHSPRTAAYTLLIPVLGHGVYDALALSGQVNPYVGGICFLVLIYFCIKMHKFSYKKIVAQLEKDKNDLPMA